MVGTTLQEQLSVTNISTVNHSTCYEVLIYPGDYRYPGVFPILDLHNQPAEMDADLHVNLRRCLDHVVLQVSPEHNTTTALTSPQKGSWNLNKHDWNNSPAQKMDTNSASAVQVPPSYHNNLQEEDNKFARAPYKYASFFVDDLSGAEFVFRVESQSQSQPQSTNEIHHNDNKKRLVGRIKGRRMLEMGGRSNNALLLYTEDDLSGQPRASLQFRFLVIKYNDAHVLTPRKGDASNSDPVSVPVSVPVFVPTSTPMPSPTPALTSNCCSSVTSMLPEPELSRPLTSFWELLLPESASIHRPPIFGGHRGQGKRGTCPWQENTIRSFSSVLETSPHVPFVELDVQMTSDDIPVVFHDLQFLGPQGNYVALRQCTFQELYQFDPNIPSLKQVLVELPPKLGINIELKYPHQDTGLIYPERNFFVDAVLEVVTTHNQHYKRPLLFSSFDLDTCIMLHRKQSTYPVFALCCDSDPVSNREVDDLDSRGSKNVFSVSNFAQFEQLQGVVTFAPSIIAEPDGKRKAQAVREKGLALATFGALNMVMENIRKQVDMGVQIIIADNVGSIARQWCASQQQYRRQMPQMEHLVTESGP